MLRCSGRIELLELRRWVYLNILVFLGFIFFSDVMLQRGVWKGQTAHFRVSVCQQTHRNTALKILLSSWYSLHLARLQEQWHSGCHIPSKGTGALCSVKYGVEGLLGSAGPPAWEDVRASLCQLVQINCNGQSQGTSNGWPATIWGNQQQKHILQDAEAPGHGTGMFTQSMKY